jgi:hypothetical protein|tara:strand:+ start:94 stop:1239 length:1146 start_codon:yes stop_codon:yes gene_type:complete
MNYLILTPDRVGSTILQSVLTMCLYLEGKNVINTHEFVNGLELKNGLAIKNLDLQYTQNLRQITDVLKQSSEDTILVSRLAKYHLDKRNDKIDDQKYFYNFLNKHFDKIIMCVRDNIFEYAMSWSIREKSGVLDVYNKDDRNKVLQVSEVDESFFIKKCQEYADYQYWITTNFPNVQQISYEDMVINSDSIIETLTGYKNTFQNHFGIPLTSIIEKEYNFLSSLVRNEHANDFSRKLLELQAGLYEIKEKDKITDTILELVSLEKQANSYAKSLSGGMKRIPNNLNIQIVGKVAVELRNEHANEFSKEALRGLIRYRRTSKEMLKKNIMFHLPFKNTTLTDKKNQIKNFDSCLGKFYKFAKNHNWIDQSKATYDFWNKRHL